ncbi:MAG: NAD(P)H-binding protein [Caldimonas sp.]
MAIQPIASRTALLAGATGLIGRALLPMLLRGDTYRRVTVLARGQAQGVAADPKLDWLSLDFAHLPDPLPAVDDVYIALGTTIKVAGSQGAFRQVDFEYVAGIARAARAAGATHLGVVSALGADSASRVFYNRVKGDMQAAIGTLGYEAIAIAQPSMLIGDRAALGQPVRSGEVWVERVLRPVMELVPRSVRPIAAAKVAAALLQATLEARPGVRLLSSAQMQSATPDRSA